MARHRASELVCMSACQKTMLVLCSLQIYPLISWPSIFCYRLQTWAGPACNSSREIAQSAMLPGAGMHVSCCRRKHWKNKNIFHSPHENSSKNPNGLCGLLLVAALLVRYQVLDLNLEPPHQVKAKAKIRWQSFPTPENCWAEVTGSVSSQPGPGHGRRTHTFLSCEESPGFSLFWQH